MPDSADRKMEKQRARKEKVKAQEKDDARVIRGLMNPPWRLAGGGGLLLTTTL